MKKNMLISMAMLIAIAFTACKKSADAPEEHQILRTEQAQKVYSYIIGLGFSPQTIVEYSDEFIVEEDIIFPKDMKVPDGKVTTEQYYNGSQVSADNVTNLRLKIDASMTSMRPEINSAINMWNNISGCTIHWTVVSGSSYDVLITTYNPGKVCGSAVYPSSGLPGRLIHINKNFIAGNSFAQRTRTICHEMGHTVSFKHTNWSAVGESAGIPVPGVGGTDPSSIMNGGQCGRGATVLSAKDKNAAVALYH